MPRRTELPSPLDGVPLTTDDLREVGLSPKLLRGRRFVPESRGLYLPAVLADDLLVRCAGVLRMTPAGSVLSHQTAAAIWSLPLPAGGDGPVHVSTPRGVDPPHRHRVLSHSMELPGIHVTTHNGLAVTTPARTAFDLGAQLDLASLVALGDVALHSGLTTAGELRALAEWGRGRRGVRRFIRALDLMDPRAESPPESALRVWFALAGLPPFEPNVTVWDEDQLVARVDLLCRRYALAVEYEGSYHRSREQYADDIRRRSRLEALGLQVVQVEATMMRSPRSVVHHVAQALRRRGWGGRAHTSSLTG